MARLLQAAILAPAFALVLAGIALLPGCNRSVSSDRTTVRGLVTFQGKPLAGGIVAFSPDPERGERGKPITAEVDRDGRFQLKAGNENNVPQGWYRVAIAPAPLSSMTYGGIFPPEIARPDRSGLIREVKQGQDNVFEFIIEIPCDTRLHD